MSNKFVRVAENAYQAVKGAAEKCFAFCSVPF